MHTFPSSTDILLKDTYLAFAREKLASIVPAITQDQDHALRKKSLKQILATFSQAGYLGITAPKELGGLGLPFLNLIFLTEVIGQFEPGLALTLTSHTACLELINQYGSNEQKSRYLPALASGSTIGCCAFAEEQAGTDIKATSAILAKDKNGFTLSGKKTWVMNAEIAELAIVLANYGEKQALVIIDLKQKNQITISADKKKLGLSSLFTNDVEFKELAVSDENMLTSTDGAYEQVLYAMDIAKVMVAGAALGIMDAAQNEAVSHAQKREQFGKNIGHFQGVQWKIADLSVALEGARLQTYRAAWSKDESPTNFRKFAAMCKLLATKAATTQSGAAIDVLASSGIVADNPLARFYRDAKVLEICEGTAEFQKMLLVKELEIEK